MMRAGTELLVVHEGGGVESQVGAESGQLADLHHHSLSFVDHDDIPTAPQSGNACGALPISRAGGRADPHACAFNDEPDDPARRSVSFVADDAETPTAWISGDV